MTPLPLKYRIDVSLDAVRWMPLTNVAVSSTTTTILQDPSATEPARFYRAISP